MPNSLRKIFALIFLLPVLLSIGGCPCGFDCSDDDDDAIDDTPAALTLGFSDANIDGLSRVVIEVDFITFRRDGSDDIVVDVFTIADQSLVDTETFQVDLLAYRGLNQLLVIEDLELEVGSYDEVLIGILDQDVNYSFVEEIEGELKVLNAPEAGISLPGFTLTSDAQIYTVEFGLAQSVQYDETDDNYLLAEDGVRLQNNAVAASLTGRVDSDLFDAISPCDEKTDPESGNRIYLYSSVGLSAGQLADVFTSNSAISAPANAVAPFAVAALVKNTLTESWEYAFGFLPAGDYTLAFSCDAADDDPVDFDNLLIPLASDQIYEIELSASEQAVCDLKDGGSCS